METVTVKGASHITGGGFFENIPRCLPEGLTAKIEKAAIQTPPIFHMLQSTGKISEHDMFNTFNMGVGMALIVAKEDADKALNALWAERCDAYVMGEIVEGGEGVILC
jgi:phosphoribosylformylglycinamidine cyclo-ligase